LTIAYQPISLGSACEAKFQICRKLYFSHYGKKSEAGFRMHMMPPERGEKYYGWHAFDWQRTPFSALLNHLERDFDKAMERVDLFIEGDFIFNRVHKTEHSHQFPSFNSTWTEADLDRSFPYVQRHLAKRTAAFRELRAKPGPYLYVWTASYYEGTDHLPPLEEVRRLLDLLGSVSPDHQFHLLMVGNAGKDADYSSLAGQVTKAFRMEESGKGPAMAWEGNDQGWQAILEPFAFTMHDSDAAVAAPAMAEPQAASAPDRSSFLSRLLRR
jgi:hypothetical protein